MTRDSDVTRIKAGKTSPELTSIPPLIIGGAVFNYQYTSNPENAAIYEILNIAFSKGLNAIDTSPYYGPSEILLGQLLQKLQKKGSWSRQDYFLCSKAGRIGLNEFDYSPESIRSSVMRSLQRLGTTYLDLIYLHDIEFVDEAGVLNALQELNLLRESGMVRNIGISGYPLDYLYKISVLACEHPTIGKLDAVLSYSNGCIQNTRLFDYYKRFRNVSKVEKIMNGSILSMSLLRSRTTHAFHPAPDLLKQAVDDAARDLLYNDNVELADLATRFAFRHWLFDNEHDNDELAWDQHKSIILGVSTVEELNLAIDNYWKVKKNVNGINEDDTVLFNKFKNQLGSHFDEVWPSGIDHEG